MAQIMNFKRMEVTGATKEEALAKAPFDIMGDATQAYKLWKKTQVNGITDSDKKQFMLDYLAKKSKNCAGVGFSITVDAAVPDTRERPYQIEDFKTEGKKEFVKVYQFIDDETGAILAETKPKKVKKTDKDGKVIVDENGNPKMRWSDNTKADAKAIGRKLYEQGFKSNLTCKYTKQEVNGNNIAFKMKYTPSKSSKVGTYVVFGIERG